MQDAVWQTYFETRSCVMHGQGLDVKVWRKYDDFVEELSERFPHEREGIKKFYGECWAVFNSLNSLELKSLEEPRYLLGGQCPLPKNLRC